MSSEEVDMDFDERTTEGIILPGQLKTLGDQLAWERMMKAEVPVKTDSYTPVPHGDIDTYIKQVCRDNGLYVVDQEFKTNTKADLAMGMYTLDTKSQDMPLQFRMAWQNSYDKSRKFRIATGIRIFACGNGAFWGDMGMAGRKHQGSLDNEFHYMLETELSKCQIKLEEGMELEHKWSQERLTRKQWNYMFGDLILNHRIITPTMITPLREDIMTGPFHIEKDGSHTRWGMYMNMTHAIKSVGVGNYISTQQNAHRLLHYLKAPSFTLN